MKKNTSILGMEKSKFDNMVEFFRHSILSVISIMTIFCILFVIGIVLVHECGKLLGVF